VTLRSPAALIPLLTLLRASSLVRASALLDLWGVDYPGRVRRFDLGYCLLAPHRGFRLVLALPVAAEEPVPSATALFPSAGWLEREVWDMLGIFFHGHPDLRRILTDYGFQGFPLRRDFPTVGYLEVRYDEEAKRVVTEPLEVTQEFRAFDFSSPWDRPQHPAALDRP
jgi:NADH-quinone oxidoreductase subunit C